MVERLLTPLLETLRPHFDLIKTRLETLAVLLFGLANCRTVNLSRLASPFPGEAKHGPNYQRLQRFFQHLLVLRVRHLLPVSSDLVERIERATLAREDVLGGFVPDEWLRLGVVL